MSALEVDNSFDIYKNKETEKLELISRQRKCLHIYYYFIDEHLGLCYFRIQTFFPFKVQIYFNGREKLALEMSQAEIDYHKDDNCFTWISDLSKAQEFADDLNVSQLNALFDNWAEKYVLVLKQLQQKWQIFYHWSIRQIEYAKDIMSFLGKKLSGPQAGRIETSCKKTYLGYRIKHKNGAVTIKIYNKAGNVLRIEITINNVSELKVYREVHQRDGQIVTKLTNMKKSIYSLEHVVRIGNAAINRYLDFLSNMENNNQGFDELRQLTERKTENNKNYKRFNPLNKEDSLIFQELLNGSFIANGFTNKDIKSILSKILKNQNWNTSKVSRLFKRLKVFGLIKKVHRTYKYFLSEKGRLLIALCVKLRNLTAIPTIDSLMKKLCPLTM